MAVELEINEIILEVDAGSTVFECAESVDVRIPTSCKKNGRCRECLIEVVDGEEFLTALTPEEEHLQKPFRLACCARIAEGEGKVRCHTMRRGAMRISHEATGLPDSANDYELAPAVTREGEWVLLDGKPIVKADGPLHGIAIDLGTTTVVVRLYDLESGELVGGESFENPQRFGGSDVLSRIAYDTSHKGRLLHRTLLGYVNQCIDRLPCDPQTIYEVVVAGNATMRDLFFGLDVSSIGKKPYRSQTENEFLEGKRDSTSISMEPKRLRLNMCREGRAYGMPLIACHVGADTAACLLAIDFLREKRTVAMMDIGTNTELVLGNAERYMCASCPAGPAFEGGLISCGMPGLEGAIEAVKIRDDNSLELTIIGNDHAQGLCGSGIISILGELARTENIDLLGRLTNARERFDLAPEHNIYITGNDISEIAQAKGANIAGLNIVMGQYGIEYDELDVFYVAGGFGQHIDLDAARRIGLIPDLPTSKIVRIGNASVEGCSIALLSKERRQELDHFVRKANHIQLEKDPDFFNHFVRGCQFTTVDTISSDF